MSDYIRSAIGYLNGGTNTNEYVGQILEINNVKLRVNRLIAEGGWALVFAVEDVSTGKEYALKRLIAADEDTNKSIIQEIDVLKKLSGHPNIIQYLHAQCLEREGSKSVEYLLVTELCPGGTLADILRNVASNSLTLAQICKIAYQVTKAVHHMHNQQPEPFVHRDIKLENFLIGSDGLIKLCDFGSTTTNQILPNPSWNAQKRATLEDQMAKCTTPMYRAPEMMDTWNNEPIGPPVDCWALGCIFYSLVTLRHPFPDGNKLAILNAKYPPLPPNPRLACLHELIKGCLNISPTQRLTAAMLLDRLAAIAESNNFDPRESPKVETAIKPLPPPRPTPPSNTQTPPPKPASTATMPPLRPVPIQQSTVKSAVVAQPVGLFSSLKGGAGSFLRNIKDTSSKVMHTVQQSMARTELDASYLTSRILIMPYPADGIESAYRANHVEDVRNFLQSRHPPPTRIQLYNLSRGRPNVTRLPGRHIDCSFAYASADSNAPLLSALYQICQDIYRYLNADFNRIVVLYCTDGYHASATVACALLIYAKALFSSEEAIALFTTRRCLPPHLQSSELRCINYMTFLSNGTLPHTKPLILRSLVIQPVPLFTRAKDGCRPYIEIYSNGAQVFSTKRQIYEEMRLFGMMEGKVCIIIGDATVRGDVTIVLFHARQQLGRVIGIKIASLHFHTGYVSLNENALIFDKQDLDEVPEVGGKFRIILNVMFGKNNSKLSRVPAPWEAEESSKLVPDPLFGSTLEMEETLENFRTNVEKTENNDTPESVPETSIDNMVQEEISPIQNAIQEKEDKKDDILQEADLLNLGLSDSNIVNNPNLTPAIDSGFDIFSSSSQNENDLLGGFGVFTQQETTKSSLSTINDAVQNDLLFGNDQSVKIENSKSNVNVSNLLFDQNQSVTKETTEILFDPLSDTSSSNFLGGLTNSKSNVSKVPNVEENFPRNASVPNFAAQNKDPFANLAGSLGTGLTSSWNGTPRNSNTPQSASPAPASTPIHSSPSMHKSNTTNDASSSDINAFSNKSTKTSGDAFEDLLGSQGYNFFSSRKAEKDSPKTINQMRKVEAAKTMDPDRLKVTEWTEGKKGNLRALLCSLHTVLWPEAERWQRYEMHQLVTAADVKKAYRKACLAVHPDKQTGTANENIAKLIFMELNNAWTAFENDTSQQNLFS
ncbi:cyclin-G-associated kinase isoform X1 [Vespa velutina]|uniref:cyclin-G-associated kinase isoform X1 n=1 Tax=Vespa velutina TaxID=202808 RepID=UPI001FB42EC9|nr:cyclin-G-associated kinase isoform X1 [Vespa velutina]